MPPNSQSERRKEHHLFTFFEKKKGEVELCVCMKGDVSCCTEGKSLFLKSPLSSREEKKRRKEGKTPVRFLSWEEKGGKKKRRRERSLGRS